MKQNKGLDGSLKPEHKKTTNRTMKGPTTYIDSQVPNIWNGLLTYTVFMDVLRTGGAWNSVRNA